MDQSQPTYIPSRKSKLGIPALFAVVVVLAGLAVVGSLFVSSQQSTDSRSKATLSHTAAFDVQTREEGDTIIADIFADTNGVPDATIRSFEVSVQVEATTSAVLGTTTGSFAANDANAHRVQASPDVWQKIKSQRVRVCLDDVKVSGSTLTWNTACKGDRDRSNCATQTITLSPEEKARYEAWASLRKPDSSKCIFLDPPSKVTVQPAAAVASPVAVAKPSLAPIAPPTSAPQAPTPVQPTALPSPTPLSIVFEAPGVSILAPTTGFNQEKPTVDLRATGTGIVTLKGTVANSVGQQQVHGRILVAQIRLKKSASAPFFRFTLVNQSLKGTTPLAPGIEINLVATPAPVKETTAPTSPESPAESDTSLTP